MQTEFEKTFHRRKGKYSDKWSAYLIAYGQLLDSIRGDIKSVLEIGIQNGGCLEMWADYLPHVRKIVGCDIDPRCEQLTYSDPRITVVVGDANAPKSKKAILAASSTFDVIVDDGSHHSTDVIKMFWNYFPTINPGGLLIIEDLSTSYWQTFEGGLSYPQSSMQFLKALADITNFDHWGVKAKRLDLLRGFSASHGLASEDVLATVQSVTFMNSLCIIRKSPLNAPVGAGHRVGSGSIAAVNPEVIDLAGMEPARFDQSANVFAKIDDASPAVVLAEVIRLRQSVEELTEVTDQMRKSTSWRVTRPLRAIKRVVARSQKSTDE